VQLYVYRRTSFFKERTQSSCMFYVGGRRNTATAIVPGLMLWEDVFDADY
jgi:hypothetical protein